MRARRSALAMLLALAAALGLAGCSSDSVAPNRFSPDLVSATVADSVATGHVLDIKVQWRARTTCQRFEGFTVNLAGDTSFTLIAVALDARDPSVACTPRDTILEGRFRINNPPAKRFHVEVFGANQRFPFDVQGGAAPAALERYRIHVTNAAPGGDVPGAIARVIDWAARDTVAVLTTDSTGTAEVALACTRPSRAYQIWVTGSSGRQANLVFHDFPQECGVPERSSIRL